MSRRRRGRTGAYALSAPSTGKQRDALGVVDLPAVTRGILKLVITTLMKSTASIERACSDLSWMPAFSEPQAENLADNLSIEEASDALLLWSFEPSRLAILGRSMPKIMTF